MSAVSKGQLPSSAVVHPEDVRLEHDSTEAVQVHVILHVQRANTLAADQTFSFSREGFTLVNGGDSAKRARRDLRAPSDWIDPSTRAQSVEPVPTAGRPLLVRAA